MITEPVPNLSTPLSVLSLEDDSAFLKLVEELLKSSGFQATLHQVETREDFMSALERGDIDLILSDYQLPSFDGLSALAIAQERRPEVPFILLSGVLGEELAVEALHHGATDYVLKQRLSRLVPTVRRAVEEARLRRERKAMETQLRDSEKLAATSRLAAAVAHEINNPLAGIKNSFRLVRGAIPTDHPHYAYVGLIEGEIDRMAGIVRQMFDLYHPQREMVKDVSIGLLCRQIVEILEPARQAAQVRIHIDVPDEEFTLQVGENSLRQILLNIVKNAIEASPVNGHITITARPSIKGAVLIVKDDGPGIPQEVQAQIFEPFFTTKTGSKEAGGGLGLSIARGLVLALNGSIEFNSQEGMGTVFTVDIPNEKQVIV